MTSTSESSASGRGDRPRPEGARVWLVPDCYLPERSAGGLESHEAICVLNTGDEPARLDVDFFFEDREPVSASAEVPARRTRHIRTADLAELPRGVPFAARVESTVPVAVQCSRLDASQAELALMTTVAFPGG